MILESAKIEQNVLPIIKTCIEGTLKASDNVNPSAVRNIIGFGISRVLDKREYLIIN